MGRSRAHGVSSRCRATKPRSATTASAIAPIDPTSVAVKKKRASPGLAVGGAHGFMRADVLEAAADAIGLDSDELIGEIADGTSLEEIAESNGVDYEAVKASIIAAVEADVDAAVAEGLDHERADAMLERVQAWLDEGGAPRFGRFGAGGPAHRGGPWH